MLDSEAPMRMVQTRTSYNKFIQDSTKVTMAERDRARVAAKLSEKEEDWALYRKLRNRCTALQKSDRVEYYKNVYNHIENEHDSQKLFATTRTLLGWQRVGPPVEFQLGNIFVTKQKEITGRTS